MALKRTLRRHGLAAGIVLGLVALPLTASSGYQLSLYTTFVLHVLLLVGLNLISGHGGQLSLGHAAFYGVGAYTTMLLVVRLDVPLGLAIIAGPIAAALLAVVVGGPSLRLRGLYFAMATLAVGVIVDLLLVRAAGVTGGPDGVGGILELSIFGLDLTSHLGFYYTTVILMLAGLALSRAVVSTWVGWVLVASKESEPAVASSGGAIFHARLAAFVLAGALAGVAGSLEAIHTQYISPSTFTIFASIEFFVVLFIGGLATTIGPFVGAGILYIFDRWLVSLPDARPFILGAVFLVSLRFFPEGVGGLVRRALRRRRHGRDSDDPEGLSEHARVLPVDAA